MIGNIKRKFPPKTGMREKQLLQDPGNVNTVDTCMLEIPSRVDVGKDQRVNQVRLANYANELSGK